VTTQSQSRSDAARHSDGAEKVLGMLDSATKRGSTADAVTDALREAILDGKITASSWLREGDLAAELNVSRTPVREAIRRLVSEGLAMRVPNQGARVTPMAMEDILAVYMVRENLEGLAARLASQRTSPQSTAKLRDIHERLSASAAVGDVAGVEEHNLEFHRAIREASGNQYLERFLTLVEHAVRRSGSTTFNDPLRIEATLVEHGAILDAIIASRPDDADFHARGHMRRARDARIETFLRDNT
jgi:DNA-binding GntR family transcriptional regulator